MSLSLSRVADGLVAVLLAPACAACGTSLSHPSRGPVCDGCWNAVGRFTPPLCRRCGDPLPSWRVLAADADGGEVCRRCIGRQSPLTRSRAIGAYDGTLRAILHAFKYDAAARSQPGWAPACASRLPTCSRTRTSSCRCRSIAAGGGGGASTRHASSRRSWGCRWLTLSGEPARHPRRPTSRPTSGTRTCGTRLRSGAGTPGRSYGDCGSFWWTT